MYLYSPPKFRKTQMGSRKRVFTNFNFNLPGFLHHFIRGSSPTNLIFILSSLISLQWKQLISWFHSFAYNLLTSCSYFKGFCNTERKHLRAEVKISGQNSLKKAPFIFLPISSASYSELFPEFDSPFSNQPVIQQIVNKLFTDI